METYIGLNSRFELDAKNRSLIDLEDGVIYTEKEEVEELLKQISDDKEFNRSMEKTIRETWGLKTGSELYEYNWKRDSWFVKIYRTEMREYKERTHLSPSAGLVLVYMLDYIEYQSNRITKKNGKSFTNKELIELVKISENTLVGALNELEEKHFIKRVGNRRAREIYFNPYLATSGIEVEKKTIGMFEGYVRTTSF